MDTTKMEEMLSQLIRMVGSMQSEMQEMKADIRELKAEMQEVKADIRELKVDMQSVKLDIERLESNDEKRHLLVLKELRALKIDQDFVWEKAVRNEREIEQIKGKIN